MIPYSINAENTIIMQASIQIPIAHIPFVFGIEDHKLELITELKLIKERVIINYHKTTIKYCVELRYASILSISCYLILIRSSSKITVTVNRPGIDDVPIRNPSQLLTTIKKEGRYVETNNALIFLLNCISIAKWEYFSS